MSSFYETTMSSESTSVSFNSNNAFLPIGNSPYALLLKSVPAALHCSCIHSQFFHSLELPFSMMLLQLAMMDDCAFLSENACFATEKYCCPEI